MKCDRADTVSVVGGQRGDVFFCCWLTGVFIGLGLIRPLLRHRKIGEFVSPQLRSFGSIPNFRLISLDSIIISMQTPLRLNNTRTPPVELPNEIYRAFFAGPQSTACIGPGKLISSYDKKAARKMLVLVTRIFDRNIVLKSMKLTVHINSGNWNDGREIEFKFTASASLPAIWRARPAYYLSAVLCVCALTPIRAGRKTQLLCTLAHMVAAH